MVARDGLSIGFLRGASLVGLAVLLWFTLQGCESSSTGPAAPVTESIVVPPVVPPPDPGEVSLAAVGDVLLDRGVAEAIARNGLDSILPVVADRLEAADIAFANLECPLAATGRHDPEHAVFRADPATVAALLQGSFDVLSLANNHTLDAGQPALLETIDHLETAGIRYVGAARDPAHGSDPAFLVVRGTRIGFLAFADLNFPYTCQSVVDGSLANLRAQVAAARRNCELLIVSFHWGQQGSDQPTSRQIDVARASIDAGADLILGHHPHVLQGAEIYRRRLILHSLGNFVFDARNIEEAESGIFLIYGAPDEGLRLLMVPVIITAARRGPEYPAAWRRNGILERFARLSAARGTVVQVEDGLVYVDCAF
jgi:poly-gamma-glutamate synthesis protein (capsule biosynthesis protein)